MQFLSPLFAAFAILGSFLLIATASRDLVASDPPRDSVTGTLVTAALQVSTTQDLVFCAAPVGSLVLGSTFPAVHTWGDALSSATSSLGSIVRTSVDAHDAMYRGRRTWHSGKGATSECVFTNVRSRLLPPHILGLPAVPHRLMLPAPPRSSVVVLPAPSPKIVSLMASAPAPPPWLIPDSAPNAFPVLLSLVSCTPLLTWAAPEGRNRFLRRVRISDSQVNDSITEQQILAVLLFDSGHFWTI
ncbi:hypothetical protein RhiLY_03227 [Ceratobasidium sp. AG-Ba]|nr:hypothetical protein RhiLY_03227 [Ceratobasidium sp. AG-Ba]